MKTLGIKATFILGESIINVFVKPAQHAFLLNANETRFMRRGQLKETILLLAAVAAVMVFFAWFVTTPAAPSRAARVSPTPLVAVNASAAPPSPSPSPFLPVAQQAIQTRDGVVQASHFSSHADGVVYDDYEVSNVGDNPVRIGVSSAVSPALAESPLQASFTENNTANSTLLSTRPLTVYSEALLPPRSKASRHAMVRNASTASSKGISHVVTPPLSKKEQAQVAPIVQQMAVANVSPESQASNVVEKILNDESKPFEKRVQKAREYLSRVEEAFRSAGQIPSFDLLAQLQDRVSVTVSDSFPRASVDVQLLPLAFGDPLVRLDGFGSSALIEEYSAWGTRFARISFDFSSELVDGRLPFDFRSGSLEVMLADAMQRKSIEVEARVLHDVEGRVEVTDPAVIVDGEPVEVDSSAFLDVRPTEEGDVGLVSQPEVGADPTEGTASEQEGMIVSGSLTTFVVLSDVHVDCGVGLGAVGRKAVEAIRRIRPQLVVQVGDLISATASSTAECVQEMRSTALSEVVRPLVSAGIDFFPVAGNHDVVGAARQGYSSFAESLPGPRVSGPHGKASYYSFDVNDSHFVVLYAPGTRQLSREQMQWLRSDLAAAKQRGARHFFTFAHSPLVSPPIYRGASRALSPEEEFLASSPELVELLREYNVIHFSGHIHVFADREVNGVRDVITGMVGGGKSRLASLPTFQPFTFVAVSVRGDDVVVSRVEAPDFVFNGDASPPAVGEGPSPQFDFSEAECPVSGPVAAGFLPPQRLGTGFAAPAGTRVVAPFNATVAFAGEAGGCGNAVELFHGLDAEGRGVYTGYCFLSETFVQRGQSVSRGQPIGLSGKRGGTPELYLKLHFFSGGSGIASADDAFDLTRNQFVDPMQYFGRCGTS